MQYITPDELTPQKDHCDDGSGGLLKLRGSARKMQSQVHTSNKLISGIKKIMFSLMGGKEILLAWPGTSCGICDRQADSVQN
jgi:hypothetical protein